MATKQKKETVVVSQSNLEEFKKLIRKATFLTSDEDKLFKLIPDEKWRNIFIKNFDANFEYAHRVLLNKFKDIERIDTVAVDKEKFKIKNIEKATNMFIDSLEKGEKILFITDFDNDGSLAQAIINEYLEIDSDAQQNCVVEYAQSVGGNSNRGLTLEHVELISSTQGLNENDSFLVVTADNGINSRQEQKRIQERFPNVKIIITDHHNPDPEMVIEENDKTIIFNPHYKPTEFFKKYNISGASTTGVLLKSILNKRLKAEDLSNFERNFEKINTLFKVSNMLDYVETHPADKPEKDYVITKFLQLQPLMNINNSISKIITGHISEVAIEALRSKIPKLDVDALIEEADNIQVQNDVAKVLLHIYKENKDKTELKAESFQEIFLKAITNKELYKDRSNINPNYIEQLRPLIFSLSADYDKNEFLDKLNEEMTMVYESLRSSEKKIAQLIRNGEVITKSKLENSVIAYADPNILSVFNRKFLNKVYNDENPGFSLTLDSINKAKVSGSFRSLYDISDILKNKAKLEKKLSIKIETPGHEKAAGFILTTTKPKTHPITSETIDQVNKFINDSIAKLRLKEVKNPETYILSDFNNINLIDKLNKVIRGNISHFDRITPILKLTKDTIWTDSYTTEQFSMEDLCKNKKYGYITINTDFHGGTMIIPVELIRKIVQNNYQDYLSMGYMDGGVFMADRVVKAEAVINKVDMTGDNYKTKVLQEAFEKDFKDKNVIFLSRDEIQDNPFFKYNDYGNLNFDMFEKMVIGIIDTNKIDVLAVFDVEANGFGNSKIMNIGAMNYNIKKDSGTSMGIADFKQNLYENSRGEEFLLNSDQKGELKTISLNEKDNLSWQDKKRVVFQRFKGVDGEEVYQYYYYEGNLRKLRKKMVLPFEQIKNYIEKPDDGVVIYNRTIEANMSAYLIKDKDFKVPQEMINLTGINQELLEKYGIETAQVDKEMSEFYKGKKVLFGAHNSPYDARVLRANLPKLYETLKENDLYDSALFTKEQKLAYDDVDVVYFNNVSGLSSSILFNSNHNSDYNIVKFLERNQNGYYPDRENNFLLEIEDGNYYLVDKVKHEKIKIEADENELLSKLNFSSMPKNKLKYSVEKLSEQWMVHSVLLCDQDFDIKKVIIDGRYEELKKHEDALKFFQENYHFDMSPVKNLETFSAKYGKFGPVMDNSGNLSSEYSELQEFLAEFLELNKDIQEKFVNSWMYKRVLEIKDPTKLEVTNDLVDLINYQTSIPKKQIRNIFDDAINFKDKYKVDSVMQHELHANGPFRGDIKGDIAFEDKLTLSMLAMRNYNPYDHSINNAVDIFNKAKVDGKVSFELADALSDSIAQDSYSFRQGLRYDREAITPMIKSIQNQEKNLSKDERVVIKYKLDNEVLPAESSVYTIVKSSVQLTREDIEKHKKMLGFIMLNEQYKSSMHNAANQDEKDVIDKIYKANESKCREYKEVLSKSYDYVEFNRKEYNLKQYINKAKEVVFENKIPKRKTAIKLDDVDGHGRNAIAHVLSYLLKEVQENKSLGVSDEAIAQVKDMNMFIHEVNSKTGLEMALEQGHLGFSSDADSIQESNFLNSVNIVRKDPIQRLFKHNRDFRMWNNLIKTVRAEAEYTNKMKI